MMAITVQNNYEDCMKHEVKKATEARKLQTMLGHPSQRDFERMVHADLIANCPMTEKDVSNGYALFGQNLADLRRKPVR